MSTAPTAPSGSPTPPPPPQLSCTATPSAAPLALVWPADRTLTYLVDLADVSRPRTLCTITNAYSLVHFDSANEISYAPLSVWAPRDGIHSRLVRTNVATQVTQTVVTSDTGTIDTWGWSPDGKTLAYFTGAQLWLKKGDQAAVSLASYQGQGPRGGGNDDEIAIRFSPSGTYFVAVHTVTTPLTFEIRRASDGGVVWSSPSAYLNAPGFATMAMWSRQDDRLFFRDGTGVRVWDPSGKVTTLVAGLKWIRPSMSPNGSTIAYTVVDPNTFHQRVELLDLQTLQVRVLQPDRWNAMFASDDLLLYGHAAADLDGAGTFAYSLQAGVETALPFDILLDVWAR